MSTYLTTTDAFPLGRGEPAESFDDFGTGRQFPPERERNRISQYDVWWRWSQRSYIGLDPNVPSPGERQFDIAGMRQVRRLAPNLFRFVMNFWETAIATDAPVVTYGDAPPAPVAENLTEPAAPASRQQQFLDRLAPTLMRASRLVVGDMVRYGVGVFWSRHALRPEACDPRFWFPIRPPYDPYEMLGEVIATPWSSRPNAVNDRLTVYTYPEGGTAQHRTFLLDGLTIGGRMLPWPEELADDGAGLVVPVRSREGVYGTSDFLDMAEYVAELHRRESSISEALDRHVNPHLAIPEGSLQVNADGSVTIQQAGMVIPVPEGGELPAYVAWDADFEAQERAIARAEQRILRMSSIAPILAAPGEFGLQGGLPSGTALRRLAVISVNRLKAIREELTGAWKQVIPAQAALLAYQGGERIPIDPDELRIEWPAEFGTIDDEIESAMVQNAQRAPEGQEADDE